MKQLEFFIGTVKISGRTDWFSLDSAVIQAFKVSLLRDRNIHTFRDDINDTEELFSCHRVPVGVFSGGGPRLHSRSLSGLHLQLQSKPSEEGSGSAAARDASCAPLQQRLLLHQRDSERSVCWGCWVTMGTGDVPYWLETRHSSYIQGLDFDMSIIHPQQ